MSDNEQERAEAHIRKAEVHLARGDRAGAIGHMRRAAVLAPSWIEPHRMLGEQMLRQKRWKDSIIHCSCALDLQPESREMLWRIGIATTATGRLDDARATWLSLGLEDLDDEGNFEEPVDVAISIEHGRQVRGLALDPARARIREVPPPETGLRLNDILLIDQSMRLEQDDPRIPALFLDRLHESDVKTWEIVASDVEETWIARVDQARLDSGKVVGVAADSDNKWRVLIGAHNEEEAQAMVDILLARDHVVIASPLRAVN